MRRIISVLAAAALTGVAGCARGGGPGGRPDGPDAPPPSAPRLLSAHGSGRADGLRPAIPAWPRPGAARRARRAPALLAFLERQVAARMADHDRALHRRLARAIHDEATRAGLDPLLVLALIHVESSFDPGAVSPAGATGLMQLREPTMRQEAERSGLSSADPRDPVANVRAGVRYLHRLVAAFGSVELGLMAYNAGPHRIAGLWRTDPLPDRLCAYPQRVRGELERVERASLR